VQNRFEIMKKLAVVALLLCGCTSPRPLRGGKALTIPKSSGVEQTLVQGENPSAPSRQTQETIKVRTYTLPASSSSSSSSLTTPPLHHSITPVITVTEREETRARTELGAAQKDTAREVGAKLSSLKSIIWVGLAMFIFGITSFVWPPLRSIIGSVTTSAAVTAGGLALMVLPTLIVGHELLILGGVSLIVAAWFLAHRHGHLRGQLQSSSKPIGPPAAPSNRPL
jgi:hypothetical protein